MGLLPKPAPWVRLSRYSHAAHASHTAHRPQPPELVLRLRRGCTEHTRAPERVLLRRGGSGRGGGREEGHDLRLDVLLRLLLGWRRTGARRRMKIKGEKVDRSGLLRLLLLDRLGL